MVKEGISDLRVIRTVENSHTNHKLGQNYLQKPIIFISSQLLTFSTQDFQTVPSFSPFVGASNSININRLSNLVSRNY